jgi:E3 SUMO-protein ligase NSE2
MFLESGDDSDDDELEIGGVTQNFKCPLSLATLDHPMTSYVVFFVPYLLQVFKILRNRTVCEHSYSRDAIKEYLRGGQQPCPATGCDQRITWSALKPNHGLERRIKAALRREERRREEEEEDAEVIE